MSDLSAQLSAFKNKIKSGPSVIVPRKATLAKPPSLYQPFHQRKMNLLIIQIQQQMVKEE